MDSARAANGLWMLVGVMGLVLASCKTTLPITEAPSVAPTQRPAPTSALAQSHPEVVAAFPGAEGMGSQTRGGRGGEVVEVTTLKDDGPGSLRAAIESSGPRIVVFRVAGTIDLQTSLTISKPYITIAGQTAPGQGITLRATNAAVEGLIEVETHDVIIRYLTLRAGPPSAGDAMQIRATGSHDTYNVVIDHNSMSWAVDRDLSTWYDVHDVTIQWNIFSEALNCSINPKGCHSKGVLLGGYASDENKDKPGAYFRLPWGIQMIHRFDQRVQNFEDKLSEHLTRDSFNLITSVYVGWKITDPTAFFPKFAGGSVTVRSAHSSGIRTAFLQPGHLASNVADILWISARRFQ